MSVSVPPPSARETDTSMSKKVCPDRERFPYCIVWTPIAPLTWIFPFIGHMGIATADGVIYDFAGPYTVGEDNFAFGKPTRYLQLSPDKASEMAWDLAIEKGNMDYGERMHILCWDNCHSHVARCLNYMRWRNYGKWNMVLLAFWMFFCGKHINFTRTLYTWGPFCVVVLIFMLLGLL